MTTNQWNADLYDRKHSFVAEYGAALLDLLDPHPGEHILDLGCGTGPLTQQIADRGADVLGIDSAASMVAQAQQNYPNLRFEVADATNLSFVEQFDAIFSNAVLHWVKPPEAAIASMWKALKPGGRLVVEFGGKENVQAIATTLEQSLREIGYPNPETLNPWYFPSISEYSTLLEQQGFEVQFAALFDRPTPLTDADGIQNWIKMFAQSFLQAVPVGQQDTLLIHIAERIRPQLYRDGAWFADYRRIRAIALKP
ncbi:MAG: methyltransferase domain-containing protein [Trichocoleus desertorum ATA4-8-CV12]|jgi:trans-aconitate 2-methyltransferase|nr:methyltransferase domain-containing protein [Trichocoleus desertorum ATA4-8-CV12]